MRAYQTSDPILPALLTPGVGNRSLSIGGSLVVFATIPGAVHPCGVISPTFVERRRSGRRFMALLEEQGGAVPSGTPR
jgi:hypothetical protein